MLLYLIAALLPLALFGEGEEEKIEARIVLGDFLGAEETAEAFLEEAPENAKVRHLLLKALVAQGKSVKSVRLIQSLNDPLEFTDWMEEGAWAVIKKASVSPSLESQMRALIGAFLTQDIKAARLIERALGASNQHLKLLAIHLAGYYPDSFIKQALFSLVSLPERPAVRQEAIASLCQINDPEVRAFLEEALSEKKFSDRGKIATLARCYEARISLEKHIIIDLVQNASPLFRIYGIYLIDQALDASWVATLTSLALNDTSSHVQLAAVEVLARSYPKIVVPSEFLEGIAPFLEASDLNLRLASAYYFARKGEEAGYKVLLEVINTSHPFWGNFAAALLVQSGEQGLAYAGKLFKELRDPFIRLNLAMGLVGQQKNQQEVVEFLGALVADPDIRLEKKDEGIASFFLTDQFEQVPYVYLFQKDKVLKLELLNLISRFDKEKAIEGMRVFLKDRNFSLGALSARLLLSEGDEDLFQGIKQLLKEEDGRLRVHAALTLALWAKDQTALPVLLEEYPKASRREKELILEGLGQIRSEKAVPFLLERLSEPSETLQVMAASSLLLSLR